MKTQKFRVHYAQSYMMYMHIYSDRSKQWVKKQSLNVKHRKSKIQNSACFLQWEWSAAGETDQGK